MDEPIDTELIYVLKLVQISQSKQIYDVTKLQHLKLTMTTFKNICFCNNDAITEINLQQIDKGLEQIGLRGGSNRRRQALG